MPRFAANLSLMYAEHPFLDRFDAAAADGFSAVELLFPYAHPAQELARRITDAGVRPVLFNAPPGRFDAGDRGLACLASRQADFRRSLKDEALPYAAALGCPRIHVMAGIPTAGDDPAAARAVYLDNLAWAAAEALPAGIELTIEPINPRDMPGYHLQRQDDAHAVVRQVGAPNLKVQMDLYHCQIVEGDLATRLRSHLPTGRVGHLQIAGVPERQEPDSGELNFGYLLSLIDELGWQGHVGCEYRPRAGTSAGLGWLPRDKR